MKTIQLTKGFFALVDDEDYEGLNKFKWAAAIDSGGHVAAQRHTRIDGKQGAGLMHRDVMSPPKGARVDHIHCDDVFGVIDNRKENLRLATASQNAMNSRKHTGCTSSFKGVHWYRRDEKWKASIRLKGELYRLGSFQDEIDAACAYDAAARILFGEFAHTNFPYIFVV